MVIGIDILTFNIFSIVIHTRTTHACSEVLMHNSVKRLVPAAVTSLLVSVSVSVKH